MSSVEVGNPTGREVGQVQVIDGTGAIVSRTPGLAVTTRFDVVGPPPAGSQVTATVGGVSIDDDPSEDYRVIARTVSTESSAISASDSCSSRRCW